ncbi:hypothetical protein [Rosenbergiella metrosideri]|uniref:hypothetical protein n=1 Tax=Rosenbergiella metrosideri TaxID=2921185 RepID=UPI001F5019D3|nr:hypothetical protein [Rosenbergiella metrosideri]
MSKSTYDPLPPFHLSSVLDDALGDIEYERQQSGNDLLKEDDKHSLTLLGFGINKLIEVEMLLRQEQNTDSHSEAKRYLAGTSYEHPAYNDYDVSDWVRGSIIDALNILQLPRVAMLIQEISRKESLVTSGYVINNVKDSQKRIARKGAQASKLQKQKLLNLTESLARDYCADFSKRFPNRSITIIMIANAIHDDILEYMLSSPTLISTYKITQEEQQHPETCSRIDTLKKNISQLKKSGKLQPWLSPKK